MKKCYYTMLVFLILNKLSATEYGVKYLLVEDIKDLWSIERTSESTIIQGVRGEDSDSHRVVVQQFSNEDYSPITDEIITIKGTNYEKIVAPGQYYPSGNFVTVFMREPGPPDNKAKCYFYNQVLPLSNPSNIFETIINPVNYTQRTETCLSHRTSDFESIFFWRDKFPHDLFFRRMDSDFEIIGDETNIEESVYDSFWRFSTKSKNLSNGNVIVYGIGSRKSEYFIFSPHENRIVNFGERLPAGTPVSTILDLEAQSGGGFVLCYSEKVDGGNGIYLSKFDNDGILQFNNYLGLYNAYSGQLVVIEEDQFALLLFEIISNMNSNNCVIKKFSNSGEQIGTDGNYMQSNCNYGYQNAYALPQNKIFVTWLGHPDGIDLAQRIDLTNMELDFETRLNHPFTKVFTKENGDLVVIGSGWDSNVGVTEYPAEPIIHNLSSFNIIEPQHDATVDTLSPKFTWQSPSKGRVCYSHEMKYKLYIDTRSDFSTAVIYDIEGDSSYSNLLLEAGNLYHIKVLAKNILGDSLWSSNTNAFLVSHAATMVEENNIKSPDEFVLHQNYPNPFNPTTTIKYELPTPGHVSIKIFDLTGRLVKILADQQQNTGAFSAQWDGTDLAGKSVAAGVYIYRVEFVNTAGQQFVESRKMSLVK